MPFLIQRIEGEAAKGRLTGTARMSRVDGDTLTIGRGAAANLRFDEASVALEHARIAPAEGGGLEITDLGSVTGTYLNGKRVERAPVRQGDWVEIGRQRLSFTIEGAAGAPVVIQIQELAAEREAPAATEGRAGKAAAPRREQIDYLAAYALQRKFLSRALFAVLFLVASGLGLASLVRSGHREIFRPGSVSAAHAPLGAQCSACHTPWHGAQERLCIACHSGPEHQSTQVAAPACTTCHVEHRSEPVLRRVKNEQCLSCHGDLKVKGGGQPFFAHRVTDFASDHPAFTLSFAEGAAVKRVPLREAITSKSDPTALNFGHALHLQANLRGPQGPVQLDCFSCHTPSVRTGELQPVRYDQHCQSCHRLAFEPRFPDAPHASPAVVHAFLLRSYAEIQPAAAPLQEQRRLLPRQEAEGAPLLRLDSRVLRQVVESEYNLYRAACMKCHQVDLNGVLPAVTQPAMPSRWLEYAVFNHHPHRMVACATCHAGAQASKDTGDILLPDIETCRTCHGSAGAGAVTAQDGSRRVGGAATTQCISCHLYHDKSRTGGWGATAPHGEWEAAAR